MAANSLLLLPWGRESLFPPLHVLLRSGVARLTYEMYFSRLGLERPAASVLTAWNTPS